ncbi:uncharacterized protein LOC110409235 [Herrania umbratica]|uniref:Uncharacterized protein LOC110409235 n=1 Tax=Herrania umbratica TaxID=108875 RepID=A0A6J0ZHJ4_9ROSI|nr:uncharacterized protein LOC110409235 [Herrania umbratica]XP_021274192.1 uncharacterized protein LOC110409235 [Herrania umbratica]
MEGSSNGRLEETPKAEAHDEEKEVILDDSPAPKLDVEFVRDIIPDGNFMSINNTPDTEDFSSSSSSSDEEAAPEEKSPRVEKSENFEEEKVVSDSVVESVELEPESVEKSGDSGVAELDCKETEENIPPSLDETNADSPILADLPINHSNEGTEQLSSAETTGDSALLTDVESKGIDEKTTLPGLNETDGSAVAVDAVCKGIEETTISCLDGNGGVPAAEAVQGITETEIPASDESAGGSSGSPDLASKENVEDSLQAANVPIVETRDVGELVNKPEIHESMGNKPIISLNHRPVEPTSWKSCCGLFEVLRRSNR